MGLNSFKKKLIVYQYVADGSFDRRDKKRIKKLTRVRNSVEEVKNQNSTKTRVKDWLSDISEEYRCKFRK